MARSSLLLGGLLGLLLAAGLALVALAMPQGHGPVYSVAQVQAGLVEHPQDWIGRTVQVRAIAEPCLAWGSPHDALHCHTLQPQLVDSREPDLVNPLPLALETQSPVLRALRHLPVLKRLLLPPPAPPWEMVRTYGIRLQHGTGEGCKIDTSFKAVLLAVRP
jgi:hypothetical protein